MSGLLAVVLQHEPHVTLGNLEPVLHDHGYTLRIIDATRQDVAALDARDGDLLIVLGGHQAAYELERHPHLVHERELIAARVDAELPLLGICLGAQLMAGALGGRNYRGEKPDISYREIVATAAGMNSPIRHVARSQSGDRPATARMLEWHGDTFDLPERATLLASSAAYRNEAFSVGEFALAVQFHPEVTAEMHEQWIADTAQMLQEQNIDQDEWRRERDRHSPAMQRASRAMFDDWFSALADYRASGRAAKKKSDSSFEHAASSIPA